MRPPLSPEAIEASRERLTEIATGLFVSEGVDAVSLRNLARAAGMSRSTPYGYFESKQEILDCIRAAGFDRLTGRCKASLEGTAGPLTQMYSLGQAVVLFAAEEPAVYQLMFGGPLFTGAVAPTLAAAIERYREVSRPALEDAVEQGLVRGDPDTIRRTTWAAVHGLISLYLHGHFEPKSQLEMDFTALNQIIAYGILTTPEPEPPPAPLGDDDRPVW
jgi:AcrR family transcriptional regulator